MANSMWQTPSFYRLHPFLSSYTESASLIHITCQAFDSETPSFFISHLYLEKNNIWASFLGVAFNRIEMDYEVADIYGKEKKRPGWWVNT